MKRLLMVILPSREVTKILMLRGEQELLRATLDLRPRSDEAALRLLEALSMWFGQSIEVVLGVEDPFDSSSMLGLDDGFGFGTQNLSCDVNVVALRRRRGTGRLRLGDFAELHRIAGLR
jgi:hypothetical protein